MKPEPTNLELPEIATLLNTARFRLANRIGLAQTDHARSMKSEKHAAKVLRMIDRALATCRAGK